MKYNELQARGLPEEVWSLIQRGLNHIGLYEGTYLGRPGPKTEAAYSAYIAGETDEPEWMQVARKEIGTKEYSGDGDNPEVLKYLKSVDHLTIDLQRNDETAWCSAFVNWCMEQVGVDRTERANARSWLSWGQEVTTPFPGAVVVLWRDSPDSWKGHVGFFVRATTDHVYLLGGNQSDQVNITRYPKKRVLRYRTAL
jgi:uncharacterized protein (TIGR02594 family)